MNKFAIVMGIALALSTSAAMAEDFTQPTISGQAGVDSRYDYRGQKYSDDASLGLGLKVSDIGIKGIYAAGTFNKVGNTFPTNAQTQLRSDVSVGYAFAATDKLGFDVSAAHVYNAPEYLTVRNGKLRGGEYSEIRVKASYDVLFAEVGQGWGPLQNTYAKVGVALPVTSALTVGAAVSGIHYKTGAENRYNNSEVFASYDVTKQLKVYGKYSFGGKVADNTALVNYGTVGVSYGF
jgi:hypothetical protein